MPSTGNPYRAFPDATPADLSREVRSRVRSLRVRLHTAVHGGELTRALAEGAGPNASDELALRARQLTAARNRRKLARSLRGVLVEAHDPPVLRARAIIDRRGALDAEAAILEMIERLGSPSPVRPQGIALLMRILTNVDGNSPLYNASEPGTLRRMIRGATAALDAQPARSHEFALNV